MTRPAALICDMEGVLHVDWQPLPGSAGALARARAAGLRVAVLTNTTGRSRSEIAARLAAMDMPLPPEVIVTAASATAGHVRTHHPGRPVHLLAEEGARSEFADVRLVEDPAAAEVIVIGGPHAGWCYPQLDAVFRALLGGAALVAMQRNRWWPTASGPAMDAGGFVAALEYAASVRAEVVGKPSPAIFRQALDVVGAEPGDALMVGDDLDSDLRPAAAAGIGTCLVRTGKGAAFTPQPGELSHDEPDLASLVDRLLAEPT